MVTRIPTRIPVTIVRQGGEQVIVGEATVDETGELSGQIKVEALEEAAEKTLGNMSLALALPKSILRRIVRQKHPHSAGKHERPKEGQ